MAEKALPPSELEARNNRQRKTIEELTQGQKVLGHRIAELEIWERFATYLLHHCDGKKVTPANLELWLAEMLEAEKPKKAKS